jgi:hypothetical protein
VFEELLGKLGGDDPADAKGRLTRWMDAEIAMLGSEPVGDAPDAFWRKRFAAWVGVTPTPTAPPETAAARLFRGMGAARTGGES